MPTFVVAGGLKLPESEVIAQYLCDKYATSGPSLTPDTAEARACCNLATRVHDVYIAAAQGAMYRGPMDRGARANGIAEIAKQIAVLEEIATRTPGPFIAGTEKSTADAALFPTFIFIEFLLPKYFGWRDAFAKAPNLKTWYAAMLADADAKATYDEVRGGLEAWESAGRFQKVGIVDDVADASYTWAY
jgi:glutathione S-transferase